MTIFFCKGLTRNPEIINTSVRVLPTIWRLGQVMDTKSGTNVSNRTLLDAAKCHGYTFYRFRVIKGKPTGGENYFPPPPQPRLGLKLNLQSQWVWGRGGGNFGSRWTEEEGALESKTIFMDVICVFPLTQWTKRHLQDV